MLALVIILAVPAQAADAPAGLPAIFRNVSAPAGGTAQLQLFLTNGGLPARIVFAGSAPQDGSQLYQIKAEIPQEAVPGSLVPLVIRFNNALSQPKVAVAVR